MPDTRDRIYSLIRDELAKTLLALNKIDDDWAKRVMNGVPDNNVCREIDGLIVAKRRELQG